MAGCEAGRHPRNVQISTPRGNKIPIRPESVHAGLPTAGGGSPIRANWTCVVKTAERVGDGSTNFAASGESGPSVVQTPAAFGTAFGRIIRGRIRGCRLSYSSAGLIRGRSCPMLGNRGSSETSRRAHRPTPLTRSPHSQRAEA